MELLDTVERMQKRADALRREGRTIGLVPTMGFLHEGHLELMRVARPRVDVVVTSIFVNPTQFGPNEDLDAYPRDTEGDCAKVEAVGGDIVFMPSVEEMYPAGYQTTVKVDKVTQRLCGRSRPVHFAGVATVVTKLFNMVKPHLAVFGEKDFQQLVVIRRLVTDLNMNIEIVGVPTYREPDGLAMSSRNKYLHPEERVSALCLKKSLDRAVVMCREGVRDARHIREAVESIINSHPSARVDYVAVCDPRTLEEVETLAEETLVAIAAHVGTTRLIDNCLLRSEKK